MTGSRHDRLGGDVVRRNADVFAGHAPSSYEHAAGVARISEDRASSLIGCTLFTLEAGPGGLSTTEWRMPVMAGYRICIAGSSSYLLHCCSAASWA